MNFIIIYLSLGVLIAGSGLIAMGKKEFCEVVPKGTRLVSVFILIVVWPLMMLRGLYKTWDRE